MKDVTYKIFLILLSLLWSVFFVYIELLMLNNIYIPVSPFFLMFVSTLWIVLIYYLFDKKFVKKCSNNISPNLFEKNYLLIVSFLFLIFALLSIFTGLLSDFYMRAAFLYGYYIGEMLLVYAFTFFTFFLVSSMVMYIKYKNN